MTRESTLDWWKCGISDEMEAVRLPRCNEKIYKNTLAFRHQHRETAKLPFFLRLNGKVIGVWTVFAENTHENLRTLISRTAIFI